MSITTQREIILRLRMAGISTIYALGLILAYVSYLSRYYEYMGFYKMRVDHSLMGLTTGLAFTVFVSLSIKPRIRKYSQFVIWFLFFLLYVPIVIVFPMQGVPADGGTLFVILISVSFLLVILISEIPITIRRHSTAQKFRLTKRALDNIFFGVSAFVAVILVIIFRGNISILGFSDFGKIYESRTAASELIQAAPPGIGYLLNWLPNFFSPMLMAIGFVNRRPAFIALGVGGELLTFFIYGGKFIVAIIAMIVVLYFFVMRNKEIRAERIGLIFVGGITLALALVAILGFFAGPLIDALVSQSLMRTYGNPGMVTGAYYDFFLNNHNPLTYYSQIGPVRLFVKYPYVGGLGQVIGEFWGGSFLWDINANFWATDGIASLGLTGVVLIGMVLGIFLVAVNGMVKRENLAISCLSGIGIIWGVADTGLTTTILTNGWFLNIVYLFVRSRCAASSLPPTYGKKALS